MIAKNPEQLPKLDRVFDTIEERTTHLTAFLEGYARFARLPKPRPDRVPWQSFLDNLQALFPHVRFAPAPTLDGWFDAGAEMPVIVLPPGRPVDELDQALEALRPGRQEEQP